MFLRPVSALLASFAAGFAWGHPGHPTLDPDHVHAPFEPEPIVLLALALVAVVVAVSARGSWRRIVQRARLKK